MMVNSIGRWISTVILVEFHHYKSALEVNDLTLMDFAWKVKLYNSPQEVGNSKHFWCQGYNCWYKKQTILHNHNTK